MAPKAHINPVGTLISMVFVLLLVAVLAQPANAGRGIILHPPFTNVYRVTAYFDHQSPNYIGDNYNWIYNGERVSSFLADHSGEPYPYDGHDGWDFSMGTGTDVLAAAPGQVVFRGVRYGNTLVIKHDNDYYTQYSHLSSYLVSDGEFVVAGQHIAESGSSGAPSAHLHFTVSQNGYNNTIYAIDPFGWRGTQRDPLYNYNGKESSCLWAGGPGASISCADFIVEDDGAGWSQSGSWTQTDYGNGFRQHWTYSWNPADYWAKWTPSLPYQGFYQVQAFVAFINATTTNARYETHQPYGTAITPVNQNNISDNWASLGTYFLDPATAYVQLYDYTGEPNGAKQIAADSMKFSASVVHLPYVRNNQNGWITSVTVRNNSASTAQGVINYYQRSGGQVSYTTFNIVGNGTTLLTPPAGFDGAAVVVVDQDVAVVIREENATRQDLNEYNGIFAAGGSPGWEQAGTIVYAPLVKSARYGRSSKIFIMNTGQQATVASVEFFNADGGQSTGSPVPYALNVNGSQPVNSGNCGAGNRCSARITSSNGQPLAVVVLEQDDATTSYRATYSGFTSGATQNFAPIVKRNRYGRTTGLVIENVSENATATTDITVRCFDLVGNFYDCGYYDDLPAKGTYVLTPLNVPDNFVGSALITSSAQPIVTVIYESGSPQQQIANALLSGTGLAYVPELYGNYPLSGQTWDSGIAIQNAGTGDASVTVTYYGTQVDVKTISGLQPNRVWILNRANGYLPNNFAGSAVITANQPIVAIANHAHTGSGDTTASYSVPNR